MAADVGLGIHQWFFDPKGWFSLTELGLKN
jgi:hypothetical protein